MDQLFFQDNDYDDDENALFLLNPSFGLGNGQNKPENSVLDFDETLTGMMGALAEIQKKGDSMLGSIRYIVKGVPKKRRHFKLFNVVNIVTKSKKDTSLEYLVISSINSSHMNLSLLL